MMHQSITAFRHELVLRNCTLRKQVYATTLTFFPPKNENFRIKNSDIFHISVQNIDCGYSLESPQSMFLIRNKNNNVYYCKRQFYNI